MHQRDPCMYNIHTMLIFSLQLYLIFLYLSQIFIFFFSNSIMYIKFVTYDIQDEVASPNEISQTQHQFYERECT